MRRWYPTIVIVSAALASFGSIAFSYIVWKQETSK